MKEISSVPGALIFRSYSSLIIVLIAVTVFLTFIDGLEKDVERVAIDKTLSEINASLALVIFQSAIKQELDQLNSFEHESPFIFMAQFSVLPVNYAGTISGLDEIKRKGVWYFNLETRRVIYRFINEDLINEYVLQFDYDDLNHNGKYESNSDKLNNLLVKFVQTKKIAGA